MGDKTHWLEWGLIAGLGAEVIRLHYGKQLRDWWKEWKQKPKRKRQLHPRTPEDCPVGPKNSIRKDFSLDSH
jgi:hypothetical protein